MFCHNCGAKLKNNAKFCSKCGTRIEEEDIDTMDDDDATTGNAPTNPPRDPDKFVVQLGDYQITYPTSAKTYTVVMSALEDSTEEAKKEFALRYRNAKSIKQSLFDDGLKCLDIVLEAILNVMGKLGVYAMTKEQLLKARDYGSSALDIWKNCSGYFVEQIEAIKSNAQSERDARERRKESRFRVVGGGFGLTGAAKGMLEAAAINAVTGAAHSVFNMFGNAATDSAAFEKKQDLYKDPRTINTLQYGLALAGELLKKEALYLVGVRPFPANSVERANAILDNINNGRVDKEQLQKALVQVFSMNPFATDAYAQYLAHFGDPDASLQKLADTFNLGNTVRIAKNAAFRKAIAIEFHLDPEADDYDMFADEGILEAIDGKREIISLYIEKDINIIEHDLAIIKKCQGIFTSDCGKELAKDLFIVPNIINGNESDREMMEFFHQDRRDIKGGADEYAHALLQDVRSVEFSNDLRTISRGSFYKCSFTHEGTKPFSMVMPNTLKKIEAEAFAYCENLGEVILNDGLEYIGDRAFMGCEGLKTLRIPNSVTFLGKDVGSMGGPTLDIDADSPAAACIREYNKNEQYPWLGTKVMGRIPEGGWDWDSDKIKIPDHYTAIEQYLFQDSRASKLILHSGIREISEGCFKNSKIEKIEFAEGLQRIGKSAFESCYELKKVVIPSTVKEIADCAFLYCGKITIELPEGLEKLGTNALYTLHSNDSYDLEHIETVYLPESLIEIGEDLICEFTTIECVQGSLAWNYAKEHGYKYKEVPSRAPARPPLSVNNAAPVRQQRQSAVASQSNVVGWGGETTATAPQKHVAPWLAQYESFLTREPNAHMVRVAELLYDSQPLSDVFFFIQSQRLQANTYDPNDQWANLALGNIKNAITSYASNASNDEIPLFVYAPPENSDASKLFVTNQAVYLGSADKLQQRINHSNILEVLIADESRNKENSLGVQIYAADEMQYKHTFFAKIDGPTTQITASIAVIAKKFQVMSSEQISPEGWITVGAFRESYGIDPSTIQNATQALDQNSLPSLAAKFGGEFYYREIESLLLSPLSNIASKLYELAFPQRNQHIQDRLYFTQSNLVKTFIENPLSSKNIQTINAIGKLKFALKTYAVSAEENEIPLFLYDNSAHDANDDKLLITNKKLYLSSKQEGIPLLNITHLGIPKNKYKIHLTYLGNSGEVEMDLRTSMFGVSDEMRDIFNMLNLFIYICKGRLNSESMQANILLVGRIKQNLK